MTGPGKEPWEVYVVKADADTSEKSPESTPEGCCGTAACCTPEEQAVNPAETANEAKAAAGCTCGS